MGFYISGWITWHSFFLLEIKEERFYPLLNLFLQAVTAWAIADPAFAAEEDILFSLEESNFCFNPLILLSFSGIEPDNLVVPNFFDESPSCILLTADDAVL